ncbi:uncharacterized protein LOC126252325 isoform X2 [Schistocerca nitens]|uniref:uncharacterized protein LOC126252325 isoform X2 n=1 Tax=Schistocerca nitens TaxID=7011 RepID=UPI0021190AEB|nr:uncharacterized protein LOC126252325 isoform X2 [Schistocerca nitens]
MKVFTGLAVLLVLAAAALGAHLQSLADPPVCPERIPGVILNITFYPNEDDCSKYWECDNGNLYNGSCTDGLIWNPNEDSCDWPYNYDCPYDKKKQSLLPGEVPQLQSRADPPVCPERIPGVILNITFYPNEDDCSKYWECDNGNLYNGSCTDGLIWNPNEDSCDWPYNYDCPYDKKKQSLLPGEVPQLQSRADPPVCPERIPGVILNITFYPNEDDCSKYWECDNGNLYNGSCTDGLIWNPNEDSCDWPYNYDCPYDKKKQSLLPGEVPQLQSRADPPVCPERIPGVEMNITFYPNEDDCSKYWECDNGNLYNGSCSDGLVWNPNVDSCDWPYIYDCPYDKKEQSLLPGEVPQLQSRADPPVCPERIPGVILNITFYPNEDDCSKYWECDNGNLYNGSCTDGLIWNPNEDSCDWPYNYDCPYDKKEQSLLPGEVPQLQSRADPPVCPERIPGVEMNITFYPNEDDCSKYWECDNGNLYNGSCADGLVWNPNVDSCDWPYIYDCPYDKKEQSLLPSKPTECPQTSNGKQLTVTFYPDEKDCTKFWSCYNGNLVKGSCPVGLIWNPKINACDWPYNYKCEY